MATDWIGKAHSYAARNFGSQAEPSHLVQAYLSGAIDALGECRESDRAELARLQGRPLPTPATPARADGSGAGDGTDRPFNHMAFVILGSPELETA